MKHCIRAELLERGRHGGAITDVDAGQRHAMWQRLFVALYQVVDDNNIISASDEARDGSAPDVSSASSNGDSHVSSCRIGARLACGL